MMKVLVSAYACSPNGGSEPGVGWNWVRQIGRFHEVWIITREGNRKAIEKFLKKQPFANVHWVFFDLPQWIGFWHKDLQGEHLYYFLWQIKAYFVAKQLHKEIGFDLVHHVTYVNYWMPSFLSILPVPFIWGPVGGGESSPKSFFKMFTLRNKIYEYSRNLARWLGEHNPFARITAKRARIAFATTPETAERLKSIGCKNVKVQSQVLMNSDEVKSFGNIPLHNSNLFRLVSIGRLLHWKGFHLGFMAFAQFQKVFPKSEYWIIGDGSERKNLEQMVEKFSIANKVHFLGRISRDNVLKRLAECDILVHPSLHDSGGCVCLEAMAAGLPVICLDLGGPALQVTKESGVKIPAQTPEQAVKDLANAMLKLADNPNLRKYMGKAGRKRVIDHFNLESNGEWINKLYKKIVK